MENAIVRAYSVPSQKTQILPFRVRLAKTRDDLLGAVRIRSEAYRRRLPVVADSLVDPEPEDMRDDVLLLIAENKFDNTVVGSIRLVPNFTKPLKIENDVALPTALQGKRLVEFMRLGVESGAAGQMVFSALAKAAYEICFYQNIDAVLAAGRYPVELIYRRLQFDDLLGHPIALSYADNLPHHVFYYDVRQVDEKLRASGNKLYRFMAETTHPDIAIDMEEVSLRWPSPNWRPRAVTS